MNKLLSIFIALIVFSGSKFVQQGMGPGPGLGQPASGGGTVNLGQTLSNSGNQSGANTAFGIAVVTGSDVNGYKVQSFNVIPGTAVAATTYVAVYPIETSGCGGGLTVCANGAAVCGDTTGFTMTASTMYVDTASSITTSCGILTTGASYALLVNNSSATTDIRYSTTGCPFVGNHAFYYTGETAGTWGSYNGAAANSNVSSCVSVYLVLQPQ